ncbi:MAG: hypothetical protein ACOC2H_08460 [Spirochaetota bacterium]
MGKEATRIEIIDGVLIPNRSEKGLFTDWHITYYGVLLCPIALPVISAKPYREILLFLPDGILNTFVVTVLSILYALVIGFITGLGRVRYNP